MQFPHTTFHLHECRTLSVCAVCPNMYSHMLYAPTAVAMHEVPYLTQTAVLCRFVYGIQLAGHMSKLCLTNYIHNHHNSDNSQIGTLNSIE